MAASKRLEPPGRLEQQAAAHRGRAGGRTRSPRPAAPAARAGARRAGRAWPPRSVPRRPPGRRRRASPARRRARARRVGHGSGVSSAARSRNAAAAARPPRRCARSAECAISAATASSGVAVACARCQARRSGSRTGSVAVGERPVHVAPVARCRRAVDRRADERMREAHARAELDQPGVLGRPAGLAADPEPLGGAPEQAQIAQRLGRGRQEQEPRVGAAAPARAAGRCARCGWSTGARRGARTRPRAPPASTRAEARSARAGCRRPRRGSDPARARRAAPGCAASSSNRASSARRPSTASSGNPSSSSLPPGSRTPNTNPTRSAKSRRPTNASVCAETRSSHCASSTMHTSGCSSAASASRLRAANPTRKRSGGGSDAQAERRVQRLPLRAREMRRSGRASVRTARAGRRTASSISDSTPAARAIRHPAALTARWSQQGGLADARLAAQHQHPALTRSHPGDEPTQLLTLTPTTEQARRREFGEGHPRAALSQLGSPRLAFSARLTDSALLPDRRGGWRHASTIATERSRSADHAQHRDQVDDELVDQAGADRLLGHDRTHRSGDPGHRRGPVHRLRRLRRSGASRCSVAWYSLASRAFASRTPRS